MGPQPTQAPDHLASPPCPRPPSSPFRNSVPAAARSRSPATAAAPGAARATAGAPGRGCVAVMLVQVALTLGGVAYMLTVFGDELDATLDDQVSEVQRDLDGSFEEVERSVREELDRRLPEPTPRRCQPGAPDRQAHLRAWRLPALLTSRLAGFGTTIFAEMSALAARTGAINLGQGFPDTDGPAEVLEAAVDAMRAGHNQYPPGSGHPGPARGDRRASAPLLRDRARPGRRGARHDRRHGGDRGRAARALRAGRRGRHVRALLRLLRRLRRARGRRAPAGDAAPAGLRDRPGRARRGVLAPHPAGAAQLAAQPDRQGLHARRARADRATTAASATSSRSPTRSTSTSSSTGASTSRWRRCPAWPSAR